MGYVLNLIEDPLGEVADIAGGLATLYEGDVDRGQDSRRGSRQVRGRI